MNIGQKIKEERKKAGLTQTQLSGDKISRNMLSQIESGTALPSIPTLQYLATRLGIPAAYFLADDDSTFLYRKKQVIERMRNAYRNQDFSCVISLWPLPDETDDELAFLLASSTLEIAVQNVSTGNLSTALQQFAVVDSLLPLTRYPTAFLRAKECLYRAIAENIASPKLKLDEQQYHSAAQIAASSELYHYLCEDPAYPYQNQWMQKHILAKRFFRDCHYHDALRLLLEIENNKSAEDISAFLLFHVYSDLESCYKELHDFEKAYRYSSKRISQLSAFKS